MKKTVIRFLCVLGLCLMVLTSTPALAATCDQTLNTGSATTTQVFWEQPLAFTGWSGGVVTNDMYFNGCGQTVSLKINGEDWERLRKEGKLDGLRYIYKKDNSLSIRKIVGTEPTDVSKDNFFDNTTVMYTGNR